MWTKENQTDVNLVFTKDGMVKTAPNQDFALIVFKIICSVIGIPLNILVALTLLRKRTLRKKPRNVYLLAIIFSNLTAFLPALLEVIYFFSPTDWLCLAFVALVSLPDVYLLLSIFNSLTDRYVAIGHPLWHRRNVTARRVLLRLVIHFASITLTCKFLYIFYPASFHCYIHLEASRISLANLVILFILCIVARLTVYFQTRKLLLHRQSGSVNVKGGALEVMNGNGEDEDREQLSPDRPTLVALGISVKEDGLRRMEVESTKTLVAGVTSLILLTLPLLLIACWTHVCLQFYDIDYCHDVGSWIPYFRQLGLVHAIYQPIMYLVWNREVSSAVFHGRRCRRVD